MHDLERHRCVSLLSGQESVSPSASAIASGILSVVRVSGAESGIAIWCGSGRAMAIVRAPCWADVRKDVEE